MAKKKRMSIGAKRRQYETALKVHKAVIERKKATLALYKDPSWIAEQISDAESKIEEQKKKILEVESWIKDLPEKGKTHPQHQKQAA